MMELLASLLFASAFALALSTIGSMLIRYRRKMVAALLMDPATAVVPAPSYRIVYERRRLPARQAVLVRVAA